MSKTADLIKVLLTRVGKLEAAGTSVTWAQVDKTVSSLDDVTTKSLTSLAVTNGVTEHGRTTPLGEWISPTYNSGNFTASGSMTWTVAQADVATYAYMLIGKTMFVMFALNTTSVGGTPSNILKIAIPASAIAAKETYTMVYLIDNGTRTEGRCNVAAAGTTINIVRSDVGNFSASTDNTTVFGQIFFEIQ